MVNALFSKSIRKFLMFFYYFEIMSFEFSEDRYLFSGSSLGDIRVFDLKTSSNSTNLSVEPAWTCLNASKCTISSVDLHPSKAILATTCGQRVFPIPLNDDDEDLENRMDTTDEYSVSKSSFDNSLSLWKF